MVSPKMPHDVFISYSTCDKVVANAACTALEDAQFRCWIAPRNVQPGRPFSGEITRAIGDSKVLVLIFSAHPNNSKEVLREVQLAAEAHLHVVQFKIEDVSPNDDLRYYLSAPHWLDAITPPSGQHLARLVTAVSALIATRDEESNKTLPSHLPSREVELADATFFSATIELSSTPGSKSEFFQKLRPLLANFLAENR